MRERRAEVSIVGNDQQPLSENGTRFRRIEENLAVLYGQEHAPALTQKVRTLIEVGKRNFREAAFPAQPKTFSEQDIALITYAGSFRENDRPPLQTLHSFLSDQVGGAINTVHLLPFYPASSDAGFSVMDFYAVDSEYGTWEDVGTLARKSRVMVDLVINHASAKGEWFENFRKRKGKYADFFINYKEDELPEDGIKEVFRPRHTPLLTPFETDDGIRHVWTTFGDGDFTDQVDLNYKNPEVLLEMLTVMLSMKSKGVNTYRLDSMTYVWKELYTSSTHRPQVHSILQLFRDVAEEVDPSTRIITETNVAHDKNIAYLGNGENEAHMVYNFALPPLVLHTFYTGNATYLQDWAKTLTVPSNSTEQTALFNFLACHDGVFIEAVKGILPVEPKAGEARSEMDNLFQGVEDHGGILYKSKSPTGEEKVYEMDTTWWSALNKPGEDFTIAQRKFLTTYAISFALAGMPAVYYLSLFGKENSYQAYESSKKPRDLLRSPLDYSKLKDDLADPESKENRVYMSMKNLIAKRTSHPAFSPSAPQEILDLEETRVFGLRRFSDQGDMLALHNVSGNTVPVAYENAVYVLEPFGFQWVPMASKI